jgi:hypothetical protein
MKIRLVDQTVSFYFGGELYTVLANWLKSDLTSIHDMKDYSTNHYVKLTDRSKDIIYYQETIIPIPYLR